MNDLQILIDEHNDAERLQAARRKAIVDLLAALPGGGHRQIRFSNGTLITGNLLHHPDRTVVNGELSKLTTLITAWE